MGFDERPEWRLLVALGVGLVVGLERERARDAEQPRRWAGLRTFGLTSLLGGVALQSGSPVVLGVAGMAVALLALVVAWRAKEPDPGLTTSPTPSATRRRHSGRSSKPMDPVSYLDDVSRVKRETTPEPGR